MEALENQVTEQGTADQERVADAQQADGTQAQADTAAQRKEEEENKSWVAQKRREEANQKQAMAYLQARNRFLTADLERFVAAYPEVDPGKLEKNPQFKKFAGSRLYREPLAKLYGDFVELASDAQRSAVERAAGKAARSTGGGQAGGGDGLTPTQRAQLEEWNRDNPTMKMTVKEFLNM